MNLGDTTLTIIAIASAAIALLSLVLVLAMGRRLRRVRRLVRNRRAEPTDPGVKRESDWDAVAVAYELAEMRDSLAAAVQRVGLVRFDAFEDMGGQQSFAAAMLDADGTGLVLSSINGRTETRIYAKPVEKGSSSYNLSDEEAEAIRRALQAGKR